jgi:hypothetical protein
MVTRQRPIFQRHVGNQALACAPQRKRHPAGGNPELIKQFDAELGAFGQRRGWLNGT